MFGARWLETNRNTGGIRLSLYVVECLHLRWPFVRGRSYCSTLCPKGCYASGESVDSRVLLLRSHSFRNTSPSILYVIHVSLDTSFRDVLHWPLYVQHPSANLFKFPIKIDSLSFILIPLCITLLNPTPQHTPLRKAHIPSRSYPSTTSHA